MIPETTRCRNSRREDCRVYAYQGIVSPFYLLGTSLPTGHRHHQLISSPPKPQIHHISAQEKQSLSATASLESLLHACICISPPRPQSSFPLNNNPVETNISTYQVNGCVGPPAADKINSYLSEVPVQKNAAPVTKPPESLQAYQNQHYLSQGRGGAGGGAGGGGRGGRGAGPPGD